MLFLQNHHIIDLYCVIDELIPKETKVSKGRPQLMCKSELVTILIWNCLVMHQKTLKDIHHWMCLYHQKDFKHIPKYSGFVHACHELIPIFQNILEQLLCGDAPLRFMDSTMIPVCKYIRADRHKVAKNIAQFGKNHQGWHYGFKLHASVNTQGKLCQIAFTPANIYDAQMIPNILNDRCKIAVGDSHYGARVMREYIFETYGTIIIAPPHYKQTKKILTWWQHKLLTLRPKIETVFDYLKEHMHLVSSFPRSINGFIFHYLKTLVGYQFSVGF